MQKQNLVFIPGWGADERVWHKLSTSLSQDFNIIYIDLFFDEFCLDNISTENFDKNDTAVFIEKLIDKIAESIPEDCVLVGWSLGGMLAAHIAHRYHEKIASLITICTNASFVERDVNSGGKSWLQAMPLETFSAFVDNYQRDPAKTRKRFIALQAQGVKERKSLQKQLESHSALTENNQQWALNLLHVLGELDCRDYLLELPMPALMVFGDKDALVPLAASQEICSSCSKENNTSIRVEVIDECGHAPHLSHVNELCSLILGFLDSQDKRYWKDKKKIADSFSAASESYDKYADLQREVAHQLLRMMDDVRGCVADLGCGTGFCIEQLALAHNNITHIVGVDIAPSMLDYAREKNKLAPCPVHYCLADIEALPFSEKQFDWMVSSLAVQWCDDLSSMFTNVKHSLKDDGSFALSNLGAQTLCELTGAWKKADPNHVHVNRFFSDAEIIDAAEGSGFELERVSVDFKMKRYDALIDLMRDLKGIGAHNVNAGSNKGLTGKATFKALEQAYEAYRDEQGSLCASYEVQYWLFKKRRTLS